MKVLVVEDKPLVLQALLTALRQLDANLQVLDAGNSGDAGTDYRDLGITKRQAQVLALLAQGKPSKVICREMALAQGTVKIHITGILKALKVSNRTQAVIAATRLGLRLEETACNGSATPPE